MSAPTTVLFDVPGPKAKVRHAIVGVIGGAAILALLFALGLGLWRTGQLDPQLWEPFLFPSTWTNFLLPGLLKTLSAAALAIVLSVIIGIALGVGRLSRFALIRIPCGVLVEFFRAVPVLVLMLFAYFFALYVLHLPENQPFFGVVVGLVIYNSAVIAELIRSGVGSLPKGQSEAGKAIGLTDGQTMWTILLPQAITAMLPSLISQLVVILKDTALGYIISYADFVRAGQTFSNLNGNLIPTMIVMAAVFILINYALTRVARGLESALSRGRRGTTMLPPGPIDGQAGVAGLAAGAAFGSSEQTGNN